MSGLFCLLKGFTAKLLSGILSLPWSPFASLPPEVDVPLPLRFGLVKAPLAGAVPGVAELAAGSPVTDPRPLGASPCAFAWMPEPATNNSATKTNLRTMSVPFSGQQQLKPRSGPT